MHHQKHLRVPAMTLALGFLLLVRARNSPPLSIPSSSRSRTALSRTERHRNNTLSRPSRSRTRPRPRRPPRRRRLPQDKCHSHPRWLSRAKATHNVSPTAVTLSSASVPGRARPTPIASLAIAARPGVHPRPVAREHVLIRLAWRCMPRVSSFLGVAADASRGRSALKPAGAGLAGLKLGPLARDDRDLPVPRRVTGVLKTSP